MHTYASQETDTLSLWQPVENKFISKGLNWVQISQLLPFCCCCWQVLLASANAHHKLVNDMWQVRYQSPKHLKQDILLKTFVRNNVTRQHQRLSSPVFSKLFETITSLFASPVTQQLAAPQLVETQQLSPGFTLQPWKNWAAVITEQMPS